MPANHGKGKRHILIGTLHTLAEPEADPEHGYYDEDMWKVNEKGLCGEVGSA
jgi:hypothetical protein